jgi:diguanylate cyclase (GGDEF)-like protein/PAS domain S-box-containing protein
MVSALNEAPLAPAIDFNGGSGRHSAGHGLTSAVLDALPEQIAVLNAAGAILAVNCAWRRYAEEHCGSTANAPRQDWLGRDYLSVYRLAASPDALRAQAAARGIAAVLAGSREYFHMEYPCRAPRQERWYSMRVTRLAQGGQGALVAHTDITASRQAQARLRIAAIAFDTPEGMMVTDARGVIVQVNQFFCNITGYTAEEALGQRPSLLRSGRHDAGFYRAMWASITATGLWEGEIWNRRKNGEVYPERLNISAVQDEDGTVTHYVASLSDITMSKAAGEEIKRLIYYDPLTRLPNRRLLLDRLRQALEASAVSGRSGALLFLDLDNFKALNDTLGHNSGDLLLQQVAGRLQACLRVGDTVARLGGDEFVILIEPLSANLRDAATQTEALANNILAALNPPYVLGAHACHCTSSIGVTLFHPERAAQSDELLMQAEIAMYQAKQGGRNMLRFFDQGMQDCIAARVGLENELRQAIAQRQFVLYYQMQVDQLGRPTGAEALLRWPQEDGGFVPPSRFIPLAEETGLILPLGAWVLEQACSQLAEWQASAGMAHLVLAINVSARQFHQPDFGALVRAAVARHQVNPARLKLELTEGILLENIEQTIASMQVLKDYGVRFSLDDFGTGYSSLQYLKRLPLDQLKIDQSFVRDLVRDSNDQAIVLTIIAMARGLKLDVIAEGVETEAQRDLLAQLGCQRYQGYLYSKAVPADEFRRQARAAPAA